MQVSAAAVWRKFVRASPGVFFPLPHGPAECSWRKPVITVLCQILHPRRLWQHQSINDALLGSFWIFDSQNSTMAAVRRAAQVLCTRHASPGASFVSKICTSHIPRSCRPAELERVGHLSSRSISSSTPGACVENVVELSAAADSAERVSSDHVCLLTELASTESDSTPIMCCVRYHCSAPRR